MSPRVALPVSIGVLGGILTILLAKFGLPFWAGFVALAAVVQGGGDIPALKNTMIGNAFGVLCAWAAALIWLSVPMTDQTAKVLWGGAVIGVVMLGMCLASNARLFSGAPPSLYGYAAAWGYLVLSPGAESFESLTRIHANNALLAVGASMWGGAVFGLAVTKLAGALGSPSAGTTGQEERAKARG
jgi:uncharacterized protein DUF1097